MERAIEAAAVQMDVQPAPTGDRLFRADQIILDAAELGAQLVVLPELFNTGYTYAESNFHRAEAADGPTVNWMKRCARRHQVYLAGSLLLRESEDIYNSMLIVAPDGQCWRYDKAYPWGWERGYFRPAQAKPNARAVVARTALGDLGMLVCWDAAHPALWQQYAGQVDLMVVCSSPPDVTNPTLCLPGGGELAADQLGPLMGRMRGDGQKVFGTMIDEQAAWLGVPVIHGAGCGRLESRLPNGRASLLALLPGAPGLARYMPQAHQVTLRADMLDACKIIAAGGQTLARLAQSSGEGFITAEVALPAQKAQPSLPQPPARASRLAYFISDAYLPGTLRGYYRRGVRQTSPSGQAAAAPAE